MEVNVDVFIVSEMALRRSGVRSSARLGPGNSYLRGGVDIPLSQPETCLMDGFRVIVASSSH